MYAISPKGSLIVATADMIPGNPTIEPDSFDATGQYLHTQSPARPKVPRNVADPGRARRAFGISG